MRNGEIEKTPLLGAKNERDPRAPLSPGWGYRHVVAFMAFLGFFNVYCMRVNLSVAMVAMVSNNHTDDNNTGTECPDNNLANSTKKEGEFHWDSSTQGYILGSFFYGYILTQIPGGWLSEKFGGKYLFGYGVLCTAVLTLITPLAARFHTGAFIAVRVLEGIGEGVTFPAMHAMWGKWGPIMERTKLTGFSYAGAQLGTVFSMPISGVLCEQDFLGGWPLVFYSFGALACVWFVVWMMIIYNTPAEHPRISRAEREYIESGVGKKEDLATPWGAILTSRAVWATCVAHFANNWGFYTLLTCLPGYMKNIQKFNIQDNGFLSAIPYFGCWMGQVSSGFIADYLRSREILTTVNTRRLLTFCGLVVPGIMLICIQFAGCNHVAVVVLLVACLGSLGFTMGGFQVNHIDLSPNFAGVLMGLSNSWATIPGFLGPQIVGWVTKNHQTRDRWQIIFYLAAGIYFLGAILYVILARGTEQPWNNPQQGISFAHKDGKSSTKRQQVQYDRTPIVSDQSS